MQYFHPDEFKCKCGHCSLGFDHMNLGVLDGLEFARRLAGIPFIITSAVRCDAHNLKEGGSDTSSHLTGDAVDIQCKTSSERMIIIRALMDAGFNRIGIAKTFIHVDKDEGKAQNVIWVYQ